MKNTLSWLVLVAVASLMTPVMAKDPSPTPQVLTEAQETALRDFASSLTFSPPNVEITAKLTPPNTTYSVNFAPADIQNMHDRFGTWSDASGGQFASGIIAYPVTDTWIADISCGTWDAAVATWSHPDGTGAGTCPHEEGTSHRGTITATGRYSVSVNLGNYGTASRSGGVYLTAQFEFVCRYDGSENGTAQCEEQLTQMTGRGGSFKASSSIRTAAIAVAVLAAASALGYKFRSRLLGLIRSR